MRAKVVQAGTMLSLTYHEKRLMTEALIMAANERERVATVLGPDGRKAALRDVASLRRIEEALWKR